MPFAGGFAVLKGLITISLETCSFAIFNSAVLSNLMPDLRIIIPQSSFTHAMCALMVVDVSKSVASSFSAVLITLSHFKL